MNSELVKRIRVLEDIESIKKLKALYCYLADEGIAGDVGRYDELVSHFTDDGWVDFEGFGIHKGKEALGKFFKELVHSLWSYAAHMVMNPIIEVDGDNANGKWFAHVACTTRESNRAVWVQGIYDEEYVKVVGEWKWKYIKFTPDFFTPFDEGWVKTRIMNLE
jgi:SnoaL-like domain